MRTVSVQEAVAMIPDGATLMIGGFMAVGTPERLMDEIVRQGKRNLTLIANDTARPRTGNRQTRRCRTRQPDDRSHIGLNPETQRQMIAGTDGGRSGPAGYVRRARSCRRLRTWRRAYADRRRHARRGRQAEDRSGREDLSAGNGTARGLCAIHAFLADYLRQSVNTRSRRATSIPVMAMAARHHDRHGDHVVPIGVIAPDHVITPATAGRLPRSERMKIMDAQTIIAKRVAQELRPGMLVNLGIGIPTLVANFVPADLKVLLPVREWVDRQRPNSRSRAWSSRCSPTPAGARSAALPGASTFDSAMSFGLIRGGHVDMTVLGGLQVDGRGPSGELDDPGKDGPGHGRCDGPRDRRQACDRGDAARRQGQAQDRRRSARCR